MTSGRAGGGQARRTFKSACPSQMYEGLQIAGARQRGGWQGCFPPGQQAWVSIVWNLDVQRSGQRLVPLSQREAAACPGGDDALDEGMRCCHLAPMRGSMTESRRPESPHQSSWSSARNPTKCILN